MTTVEINILENESLILDVLKAFEERHLLTFSNKKPITIQGENMNSLEYEDMLINSRNTKSYTLTDAKKYLNL